jgi:hypothetical protein
VSPVHPREHLGIERLDSERDPVDPEFARHSLRWRR